MRLGTYDMGMAWEGRQTVPALYRLFYSKLSLGVVDLVGVFTRGPGNAKTTRVGFFFIRSCQPPPPSL